MRTFTKQFVIAGMCVASSMGAAQMHETHMELFAGSASGSYDQYDTMAPMMRQVTDPFAGWARGNAYMGYGYNGVNASVANTGVTNYMSSSVSNRWSDTVIIDAPGLTGTEGIFTASMLMTGTPTFNLTGAYANDPSAGVLGFWEGYIGSSLDGGNTWSTGGWNGMWQKSAVPGQMTYSGDAYTGPMWDVTIPFVYGQQFRLTSYLSATLIAENPNLGAGTFSGSIAFSPAATWNGISSIYDADSNPVLDATLTSGSGTNYLVAVPEPASMIAISGGLLVLLRRRRNRR